jgi:hypothetical protein
MTPATNGVTYRETIGYEIENQSTQPLDVTETAPLVEIINKSATTNSKTLLVAQCHFGRLVVPKTLLSFSPILTYIRPPSINFQALWEPKPLVVSKNYKNIFLVLFPPFISHTRQVAFEVFLQNKLNQIQSHIQSVTIQPEQLLIRLIPLIDQQLQELKDISTNSLIDLRFFFLYEVHKLFEHTQRASIFLYLLDNLLSTNSSKFALPPVFYSWRPKIQPEEALKMISAVTHQGIELLQRLLNNKSRYEKLCKRTYAIFASLIAFRGESEGTPHVYAVCGKIGEGAAKVAKLLCPIGTLFGEELKVQSTPLVSKSISIENKKQLLLGPTIEFTLEATIAQQCLSQGIRNILVTECIIHNQKPKLISQYCNQGTLHQYLKQTHPLKERMNIALAIVKTIHLLHTKLNYCHLDLKASNILLNRTSWGIETFICDLSTAKPFNTIKAPKKIGIVSTYPAPEFAKSKELPVAACLDLWTLGLILYNLYYNTTEAQISELAHDNLKTREFHQAISKIHKDCQQRGTLIDTLITKLLSNNPQERPSAATVVKELAYFTDLLS